MSSSTPLIIDAVRDADFDHHRGLDVTCTFPTSTEEGLIVSQLVTTSSSTASSNSENNSPSDTKEVRHSEIGNGPSFYMRPSSPSVRGESFTSGATPTHISITPTIERVPFPVPALTSTELRDQVVMEDSAERETMDGPEKYGFLSPLTRKKIDQGVELDEYETFCFMLFRIHPHFDFLFREGGCFEFFRLMQHRWHDAEAWYHRGQDHVYARLGNSWYDIRGRWHFDYDKDAPYQCIIPMDREHVLKALDWKRWAFWGPSSRHYGYDMGTNHIQDEGQILPIERGTLWRG